MALLTIVYLTSAHVASELVSYQGRDENLRTSLATFLAWGAYPNDMLFEPFNSQPVDGAAYFGIVGIALVFLATLLERSRQFTPSWLLSYLLLPSRCQTRVWRRLPIIFRECRISGILDSSLARPNGWALFAAVLQLLGSWRENPSTSHLQLPSI